jgi:hypothetical protein
MPQVVRFGRARRGDHRHDQRGAGCSQLNEGDASARTRNKGLASLVLIFTPRSVVVTGPCRAAVTRHDQADRQGWLCASGRRTSPNAVLPAGQAAVRAGAGRADGQGRVAAEHATASGQRRPRRAPWRNRLASGFAWGGPKRAPLRRKSASELGGLGLLEILSRLELDRPAAAREPTPTLRAVHDPRKISVDLAVAVAVASGGDRHHANHRNQATVTHLDGRYLDTAMWSWAPRTGGHAMRLIAAIQELASTI